MAKYRYGFVSNSSSSSFVIAVKPKDLEQQLLDRLAGTHKDLPYDVADDLVELAGFSSGVQDEYADELIEYSKDDVVDYVQRNASYFEPDDGWELSPNIKHMINSGYDTYIVSLSDESGGIGATLRSECGSFTGISNDQFVTEYLEE